MGVTDLVAGQRAALLLTVEHDWHGSQVLLERVHLTVLKAWFRAMLDSGRQRTFLFVLSSLEDILK